MRRAVRESDHAGGIRKADSRRDRFPERQIFAGDRCADRAHDAGGKDDELRTRRAVPRSHPRRGGRNAEAEGDIHITGRSRCDRDPAARCGRDGERDVHPIRQTDRFGNIHAGGRGRRIRGRYDHAVHAAILQRRKRTAARDHSVRRTAGARCDHGIVVRNGAPPRISDASDARRQGKACAHGAEKPARSGGKAG